ncbi:MAG: hypothetical protein HUU15_02815 [Candidatus Brocadiae bacterium]|nr:hypothetical protein [Candidatus Brocadiia bacterium]
MCCHLAGSASDSCAHRGGGLFFWIASWLLFPVCLPAAAAVGLVALLRGRNSGYSLMRGALLSPFVLVPVFFAMKAGADYRAGKARLHVARPADRDWNVDGRTRLPLVESETDLSSRYAHRAYDLTVRRLVRRLGRQPGAWTGPLPSREEAARALAGGRRLAAEDLRAWPELAFYTRAAAGLVSAGEHPSPALEFRRASVRPGLDVVGSGPHFLLLVNAATGREIARHGSVDESAEVHSSPR